MTMGMTKKFCILVNLSEQQPDERNENVYVCKQMYACSNLI